MDLGSREEEMILSPVSRCGVRREEEIGARLSDVFNMNSTDLIDNPDADMSAMRFRGGWLQIRAKEKAPLEGRAGPEVAIIADCKEEQTTDARRRREMRPKLSGRI